MNLPRDLREDALEPASGLARTLAELLRAEDPPPGARWLIAFSGGPDSTALAAGLAPLAAGRGLRLDLAHVDHGADPGSAERAAGAGRLAAALDLPFHLLALSVPAERRPGESPEAAARRLRYAALERLRRALGASRLVTAHHRDDQVETVLLALLRGAPLERLGGIDAARGPLLRPLLEVPRRELERSVAAAGLTPLLDPGNLDRRRPRNRLRHDLLPALRRREPDLEAALLALAGRSRRLRRALAARFARAEGLVPAPAFLPELPPGLWPAALDWLLGERLGVAPLPSLASRRDFLADLAAGRRARLPVAAPGGARELRGGRDGLELTAVRSRTPPFSYTFSVPGEIELVELGLLLRVRRAAVEPWMRRGDPRRAGLAFDADRVTVRCRRAGDRLTPFGARGSRKLKALLIDRAVPAADRDRLPLLEVGGELAWVPGVTIGARFALADAPDCWLAELEPSSGPETILQDERLERTTTP